MLIAVDFDGTIVPNCFPHSPTEFLPGAQETLKALFVAGHTLVLWTLRDTGTNGIKGSRDNTIPLLLFNALRFLGENGITFMLLPRDVFGHDHPPLPKLPFELYIEDKIPGGFQGWDFIRRALLPNDQGGTGVSDASGDGDTPAQTMSEPVNSRAQQLDEQRVEPIRRTEGLIEKALPGCPGVFHGQSNPQQPEPFRGCFSAPLMCFRQIVPPQNDQRLINQGVHGSGMETGKTDTKLSFEDGKLKPESSRSSTHAGTSNDSQDGCHDDHLDRDPRQQNENR
jgi:hypothetical protein